MNKQLTITSANRTEEMPRGIKTINTKLNKSPVVISAIGNHKDSFFLQCLHLLCWRKKERTGISSNQPRTCPQLSHFERPKIYEVLLPDLSAITSKKLPKNNPMQKIMRVSKVMIH